MVYAPPGVAVSASLPRLQLARISALAARAAHAAHAAHPGEAFGPGGSNHRNGRNAMGMLIYHQTRNVCKNGKNDGKNGSGILRSTKNMWVSMELGHPLLRLIDVTHSWDFWGCWGSTH